jgi:hypothetical protein
MLLMLAVAQFVVAQEIVDAISDDDGIPFYRIVKTGIPTIIENAANSPTLSPTAPTSHPLATPTDSPSDSPTPTFVPSGRLSHCLFKTFVCTNHFSQTYRVPDRIRASNFQPNNFP